MSPLHRVAARVRGDRMLHFVLLGALVFAIAHERSASRSKVSLSSAYIDGLRTAQAQKLGVSELSEQRATEVEHRAIEDEVLYREAMRLGLDRDDAVLRQHLVQKMLLLAEDLSGATREATRGELVAYFDRTRDHWRAAEGVHLLHVFATQRDTLVRIADDVRAALAAHPGVPPPLGDAFPHSRDLRGSRADLAATYGDELADAAMALPVGMWSEPVPSRFGWHLVFVVEHVPGRAATFEEVADRVRLAYAVELRHAAIARFLTTAFARYDVDVDGVPVTDYTPTQRLGLRSLPSAED
jgi:peptidyl-prolyl cis-trans isomerase C